jgi:hypothetical protein
LKIFQSFLVLFAVTILFLLPISQSVYAFRTDQKTDTSYQAVAGTSANVTLAKALYNSDPSTIRLSSSLNTDLPALVSYNATNRVIQVSGLTYNTTRTLSILYDYDALGSSTALNVFLDKLPWFWLLCIIGFIPAAIISIFTSR